MFDMSSLVNSLEDDESIQYMPALYEQENLHANTKEDLTENPEQIGQEAEEDLLSYESNTPEYTDMAEYPEIPKVYIESYGWPTNGMARLTAKEYWNPEMTGLEDNDPSSTLHGQMTSEEVHKWLQEPSDQIVFDRYDRAN